MVYEYDEDAAREVKAKRSAVKIRKAWAVEKDLKNAMPQPVFELSRAYGYSSEDEYGETYDEVLAVRILELLGWVHP